MACTRPGIASCGGFFPRECSMAVWKACSVVAVVPLSPLLFWSFAAVNWKKCGRVGTQLTNTFVFLPT